MTNNIVLELENVRFAYSRTPVLENVCLCVPERDFLALLGPNGGGKTTLLKICIGLLKPEAGSVKLFGKDPQSVRHLVGYVPQETNPNAFFPIRVIDVVLMGRINGRRGILKRYSDVDHEVVKETLKCMGLWELRNKRISDLSGGQRQRVMIARALAAQPKIFFMDEPTASVDRVFQTELYELLKDLNREKTVIVVSHDLSVLSSYVKSVACVNRKVYYHSAAELTQEMIEEAYHCPVELVTHGRIPHRVLQEHER